MELKLSQRLQTIAGLVTSGNVLADIGTDHGYVPIYCVTKGISPRAYAMDVKEGPLSRAGEHIKQFDLTDRIETRLSNGLKKLQPGEADTIVIAGMGGLLMKDILEGNLKTVQAAKELILSPQSDLPAFRAYLSSKGIGIEEERMVREDGKFYWIMRCFPNAKDDFRLNSNAMDDPHHNPNVRDGSHHNLQSDILLSPDVISLWGSYLPQHRDPIFREYLRTKEKENLGVLEHMTQAGVPEDRQADIRKETEIIQTCLQYMD